MTKRKTVEFQFYALAFGWKLGAGFDEPRLLLPWRGGIFSSKISIIRPVQKGVAQLEHPETEELQYESP